MTVTVNVLVRAPIHHQGTDAMVLMAIISIDGHKHQEPAVVVAPDFNCAFFGMVRLGVQLQAMAQTAEDVLKPRPRIYTPDDFGLN